MSQDRADAEVREAGTPVPAVLSVTVYSTPHCQQCKMTYVALDRAGISFTVVDLATNDAARTWVTEDLGYSQAPVVVVDQDPDNHWSGFRREHISALAALRNPAAGAMALLPSSARDAGPPAIAAPLAGSAGHLDQATAQMRDAVSLAHTGQAPSRTVTAPADLDATTRRSPVAACAPGARRD